MKGSCDIPRNISKKWEELEDKLEVLDCLEHSIECPEKRQLIVARQGKSALLATNDQLLNLNTGCSREANFVPTNVFIGGQVEQSMQLWKPFLLSLLQRYFK
jgi:hypothetical protein